MATYLALQDGDVVVSAPTFDELIPFLRYASEQGIPVQVSETVQEEPALEIPFPNPERPAELIQFLMTLWALNNPEACRVQVNALVEAMPAIVESLKRSPA